MKAISKRFALVFFLGFVALITALGYSRISEGDLISYHPWLRALRAFGVGYMAAGMVLWIALRREEGGHPTLNPLFALLLAIGCLLLLIGVVFPNSDLVPTLTWSGMSLNVIALLIGIIAVLSAPAYPHPLNVTWPGNINERLVSHDEAYTSAEGATDPQDLTRIEGIGPKIQSILHAAGITTYQALAERTSNELLDTLKAANFKAPVDATTWPQQAELAARGEWDKLRTLQEQLRAGRTVD